MHNATLISEGIVRMNFFLKSYSSNGYKHRDLPAPMSMVDGAVFHGYKRGYCTISHAY